MRGWSPDPPHIAASVYSSKLPEQEVFRLLCEMLANIGYRDVHVDTVPIGTRFESSSDVSEITQTVAVANLDVYLRAAGSDFGLFVLTAYLRGGRLGPAILKYERAKEFEQHPVSVIFGAGELGIPAEYRTRQDDAKAARVARKALDLFKTACERLAVDYGELSIEHTMPAPWALTREGRRLRGGIFLSSKLLGDESFPAELRRRYGMGIVVDWAGGVYVSGWAPFSERGQVVVEGEELVDRVTQFLIGALGNTN